MDKINCPSWVVQSFGEEMGQVFYPEIILGPPGTGKTTTLLGIVDEELQRGVPPDRIGYVSFTKKAANEAIERACKKFSLTERQLPFFRTLHSLCFWALGLTPNDVLERNRLLEFGDWAGIRVSGRFNLDEGSSSGFEQGDRILFMENLSRIRCIPLRDQYDEDDDSLFWSEVDRVSRALREYKTARGLVDYTDMLSKLIDSSWTSKLEVLLVDEAQDLSTLQWRVVRKLAATARRVVVAGDDDQAIYRWAGADIENFLSMPGSVRVLDRSYRVPKEIQKLGDYVISRIIKRRPKLWHPREDMGSVGRAQTADELDFSGDDILVLARNNFILRDRVAPILRSAGVIYEHRGVSSVKATTLNAIMVWENLRKGMEVLVEDALAVYEMMSTRKGIQHGFKKLPGFSPTDHVTLADLKERGGLLTDAIWHEALDRITTDERVYLLRALREGEKLRSKPRVRLSTIHGAKGGEAKHVILLRDMANRTYDEMLRNEDDESRVWYVAVTRAMEKLTVVAPTSKRNFLL